MTCTRICSYSFMYSCDGHPKHVDSDFAVNKYLHTVASCWILLIYTVYLYSSYLFRSRDISNPAYPHCLPELLSWKPPWLVIKVERTVERDRENSETNVVPSTTLPSPACPYTATDTKWPRRSHITLNFWYHSRYFTFQEITNQVIHHLKECLQTLKYPSA